MKKILTCLLALMAATGLVRGAEPVFVVNNCPVTPVREEPSEAAEQATQLLFGEVCELVERRSSWTRVRSTIDGQVGWVSSKMVTAVTEEEAKHHQHVASMGVVATPMAVVTGMDSGEQLMLTLGTRLPHYADGTFEVLGQKYTIDPTCVYRIGSQQVTGEDLVRVAQSLKNVSYLWGGKNMMGYDCSGFSQTVYSAFGIYLLRNAREQATQGKVVKSLAESQPGDLVFFDHADRNPKATRITHVGMLISPTQVIHCSGCVHIDRIDEMGIHLADGTLTHHLAQIKRYL
jgi:hypothetical protein